MFTRINKLILTQNAPRITIFNQTHTASHYYHNLVVMDDNGEILRRLEHLHVRLEVLEKIKKVVGGVKKSVQNAVAHVNNVMDDQKQDKVRTPGTAEQFNELLSMVRELGETYTQQGKRYAPQNITLETVPDIKTNMPRQVVKFQYTNSQNYVYQFYVYINGRCALLQIEPRHNNSTNIQRFKSIQEAKDGLSEKIEKNTYFGGYPLKPNETI